ncbi:MAG: methyltransferase [Actinomycetota bacterium]|nr:methyltransferase [Actinomycetota bacterium]
MKIDSSALETIRRHLDVTMYAAIDLRISLELEPSLTGFPKFDSLQLVVKRLDPGPETTFRLLRLGEVVEDDAFRAAFPEDVVSALLATELVTATDGGWRTPGLVLVPAQGLLLLAGTPSAYPTAPGFPLAWFDLSTSFVASTLPGRLDGERVLDVCSGTGVQALLCATRGAREVVGVELGAEAVMVAGANAVLNGLADRVEFRCSDMLGALGANERFDFVVANLPYAPVIRGDACPDTVAGLGNSVLWPLLEELPAHLSPAARGVLATWRSIGHDGSSYQLDAVVERLGGAGCAVSANLDPAFDTVDGVLRMLHRDLGQRPDVPSARQETLVDEVRALIESSALPVDGFYNQLIRFDRLPAGTVPPVPAVFGLARPSTE